MVTNVFVLCTGRCGSMTLARAFGHMTNWTSGHETRTGDWQHRFDYPANHIEVDHRLTWFLGTLDRLFDHETTLWVHLTRNPDLVAASWAARDRPGSQRVTWTDVALFRVARPDPQATARLMVDTVTDNIRLFLRGKPHTLHIPIEDPHAPFDQLWETVGAAGDRQAAHRTLDEVHNRRRR